MTTQESGKRGEDTGCAHWGDAEASEDQYASFGTPKECGKYEECSGILILPAYSCGLSDLVRHDEGSIPPLAASPDQA
jgi:hypothetical protein